MSGAKIADNVNIFGSSINASNKRSHNIRRYEFKNAQFFYGNTIGRVNQVYRAPDQTVPLARATGPGGLWALWLKRPGWAVMVVGGVVGCAVGLTVLGGRVMVNALFEKLLHFTLKKTAMQVIGLFLEKELISIPEMNDSQIRQTTPRGSLKDDLILGDIVSWSMETRLK
ncbi:hypothetical protein GALMADRAFT_213270 [Galerina marginata CBS 339.88]|uniref:Uncharacterized protein n=1 Tax=Galerina marginata (strain CBS 339.88) TaxID=685588 RepID=A0A067SMS9_GALM3|nr:hypothetical protein GALMADRAFT_213270 [Galerina marginata CBS 339.88]